MRLNLPILDQLSGSHNFLIAGMGGGFDIFCGLPIYFELKSLGKNVHLANLSFSLITGLEDGLKLAPDLIGVHADHQSWYHYFPELYLSQWFRETRREEITIWSFKKTGVRPLILAYNTLVKHLKIDCIILIDGGVDSLLRGDETQIGTLLEDSISLCAVDKLLEVPTKIVACLGLGAELEMSYGHVFENMSALIKTHDFLGSCSLLAQMESYQLYEDALLYVQNKPRQEPSVINASVVSSVRGEYDDYHLTDKTRGSRLWISPLMSIYWFFDLAAVAKDNLLLPEIYYSDTMSEATRIMISTLQSIPKRAHKTIPLT